MRRVAVTGIGVISPLGNSPETLFSELTAGRSGVRRLEGAAYERLQTRIGATVEFDGSPYFDAPKLRMMDRVSQFAVVAARQAIERAALPVADIDPARIGVFVGTGMGGAQSGDDAYRTLYAEQSDRVNPFSVLLAMNNAAASWVGLEYGATGPNLTFSTACSSSAVAIGEAANRIRLGEAEVMIAGGTEAPLTLGTMKAWEALRTLAAEDVKNPSASCKPFSKNRGGMVLGEGAAFVILEEYEYATARGANILAELAGYGLSTDVAHLTRPSAEGQARAMRLALAAAKMRPEDIGYVNAHGTGTAANDSAETQAIRLVFGEHAQRLPISSTKSMHAHLLGAAGAMEFAVSVMSLKEGVIPPTMHLDMPDPECNLDYVPNEARRSTAKAAMSNSFAFGGTNAVLIAKSA